MINELDLILYLNDAGVGGKKEEDEDTKLIQEAFLPIQSYLVPRSLRSFEACTILVVYISERQRIPQDLTSGI